MKLQSFASTTEDNLSFTDVDIVGLQNDTTLSAGKLARFPLSSYIGDSEPEAAKRAISALRTLSNTVQAKYTVISDKMNEVIPVSQTDLLENDFEKLADTPISYSDAVEQITGTYITKSELQTMINDVYAVLWSTINDMYTTCFQNSMYARQYTGSTRGVNKEVPTYSSIVSEDSED